MQGYNYAYESRFQYWSDENGFINVVEILDQNVICEPLFKDCGHKTWVQVYSLEKKCWSWTQKKVYN